MIQAWMDFTDSASEEAQTGYGAALYHMVTASVMEGVILGIHYSISESQSKGSARAHRPRR